MTNRVILAAIFIAGAGFSHAQLIPGNLKIRVEKADRINPPVAGTSTNCYRGKDNYFNEIEISAGTFYGYTANGYKTTNGSSTDYSTCAITGNQVYNMGASLNNTGVIASGLANNQNTAFSSCGYWLNGTYNPDPLIMDSPMPKATRPRSLAAPAIMERAEARPRQPSRWGC